MKHLSRELKERCYLCGSSENLDSDHVFARTIYHLTDPIVLKMCQKENGEHKSRLDEKVSLWLNASGRSEQAQQNYQHKLARLKDFTSKQSSAKAHKLAEHYASFRIQPIIGPTGLMSMRSGLVTNAKDIHEYMSIILKGLHTYEHQQIFDWDKYHCACTVQRFDIGYLLGKQYEEMLGKTYAVEKAIAKYRYVVPHVVEYYSHEANDGSSEAVIKFFDTHMVIGSFAKIGSDADRNYQQIYGKNYFTRYPFYS